MLWIKKKCIYFLRNVGCVVGSFTIAMYCKMKSFDGLNVSTVQSEGLKVLNNHNVVSYFIYGPLWALFNLESQMTILFPNRLNSLQIKVHIMPWPLIICRGSGGVVYKDYRLCSAAGSSLWHQCCLVLWSGLYLRSRPREAKPNSTVWTNQRQRVIVPSTPLSLQTFMATRASATWMTQVAHHPLYMREW